MSSDFFQPYVQSKLNITSSPKHIVGNKQAAVHSLKFSDVLAKAQGEDKVLHVSAHAQLRMQERGIRMSDGDWQKLGHAVSQAQDKGSKDTCILYGHTGFIVNVKNRTVVTTVANRDVTVITNIDSVVILPRLDR